MFQIFESTAHLEEQCSSERKLIQVVKKLTIYFSQEEESRKGLFYFQRSELDRVFC